MAAIGADFAAALKSPLYAPVSRIGIGRALAVAIGLMVVNMLLQALFAAGAGALLSEWLNADPRATIKAYMIAILPAGLITAGLAYRLARLGGGRPCEVLALHWPRLGTGGWVLVLASFILGLYAFIALLVALLGIDLGVYVPGENGATPDTGSTGLVKEALFDLANEPLFWLAWPSVIIGAPLAEEMIFRGQLFAAIAASRIGAAGAAAVTSVGWALLHATEPWLSMLIIFAMGLALSGLLVRFGSLWVTILCHALWNGLFSLVALGSVQS